MANTATLARPIKIRFTPHGLPAARCAHCPVEFVLETLDDQATLDFMRRHQDTCTA